MLYLKYFIFFLLSFLVLCIPISDKPLFFHAYDTFSPFTKQLFTFVKKEGEEKLDEGKKVGAKYIMDTVPEKIKKMDIPKSSEPLSIEEKEFLEQIL
jgi:hypothetical protein